MPQIPRNYWEIGPDGVPRMVMPKGPPGYKPRLKLPWEEEVDTPVAAQDPVMAKALRLIIEDEGEIEDPAYAPHPSGMEMWAEPQERTGRVMRALNALNPLGVKVRDWVDPITGGPFGNPGTFNYSMGRRSWSPQSGVTRDVTWNPAVPALAAASMGAGGGGGGLLGGLVGSDIGVDVPLGGYFDQSRLAMGAEQSAEDDPTGGAATGPGKG